MAAKRVAVLVSGNGSNLQALIDSCKSRFLSCDIVLTLSNKPNAFALKRAKNNGIDTMIVDKSDYSDREAYDQELVNVVTSYRPDLIVLAGWMHVFTPKFINAFPNRLINLHPALPDSFTGANCIKKTWDARDNTSTKSGVMVHRVVEEVDMGEVVATMDVPLANHDDFEEYEERMHQAERSLLVSSVKFLTDKVAPKPIFDNEKYPKLMEGKVRNMYDMGNNLLAIEHSNRLSAFDRHICDVDYKGEILTATSAWWFNLIESKLNIKTHYLWSTQNVMIARKCKLLSIEVVIRGYITGNTKTSLWTHYNSGAREYCGLLFPDGLIKNQELPHPVITPTTKGEVDEPISAEDLVAQHYMTQEQWDEVSEKAMRIFKFGQEVARKQGLLLVDTKYEFGVAPNGEILLIDEVHTCDSSRFWMAASYHDRYNSGKEPEKFDKDIVRDYLKKNVTNPYALTSFDVPRDLKTQTTNVYKMFYNKLTNKMIGTNNSNIHHGNEFSLNTETMASVEAVCDDYMDNEFPKTHPCIVCLAGSESDKAHVEKIKKACVDQGMHVYIHYASAHKQTIKVLELLNHYNSLNGQIIYVTIAGRSNALSGVVACNTQYPVFACPPFSDKSDMIVNIHSTIQMPSKVPVMTTLEPGNIALAAARIFALGRN